jgi:hypothetical protein
MATDEMLVDVIVEDHVAIAPRLEALARSVADTKQSIGRGGMRTGTGSSRGRPMGWMMDDDTTIQVLMRQIDLDCGIREPTLIADGVDERPG